MYHALESVGDEEGGKRSIFWVGRMELFARKGVNVDGRIQSGAETAEQGS